MKNFEKYADQIILAIYSDPLYFNELKEIIGCSIYDENGMVKWKEWMVADAPEYLLTIEEQDFLADLIRDFREDIISIGHFHYNKTIDEDERDQIEIVFDESNSNVVEAKTIVIPCGSTFGKFKGLDYKVYYTVEDLGL